MISLEDLILPKRKIAVPLPPSYIKFDGAFGLGTGTKLGDKSRYRSRGTIHGADWATGLHGKCLDFDASAKDYVEIPAAHTQLNFTSEDFSLIARVKIDDISDYRCIFCRGLVYEDGYYFMIYKTTGRVYLTTSQNATFQQTISDTALTVDTWYTVGFSRDGASVLIYINGVEDMFIAGTHINPATCARIAKIGIFDNLADQPFDGKIEFLRIFGGMALSTSEHLAYHNALK